jgi:hypothetical protein
MPLRRRSSPNGAIGRDDWLAASEDGRGRPWAYKELLFGSPEDRERHHEIGLVVEELESERFELAGLHDELDAHLEQIALLERRLQELTRPDEPSETRVASRPTLPHTLTDETPGVRSHDRCSYLLTRCEGFDVESPAGPVGFVDGLRFASRIDRPDVLEVRGGRFGRQLLLVPTEQVDEIRLADRRIVLRTAPLPVTDLLDDLGDRLRRALRHFDGAPP